MHVVRMDLKRRLTWSGLLLLLFLPLNETAAGEAARILKVLPHRVDEQGRHSLSPSLYERDAYQAHLKEHPSLVASMRFDIHWKADYAAAAPLTLQIELRTSDRDLNDPFRLSRAVDPPRFFIKRRWTTLQIPREEYRGLGQILAWRASLWRGGKLVAEQRSFLW